jgi:hypothetical protein
MLADGRASIVTHLKSQAIARALEACSFRGAGHDIKNSAIQHASIVDVCDAVARIGIRPAAIRKYSFLIKPDYSQIVNYPCLIALSLLLVSKPS